MIELKEVVAAYNDMMFEKPAWCEHVYTVEYPEAVGIYRDCIEALKEAEIEVKQKYLDFLPTIEAVKKDEFDGNWQETDKQFEDLLEQIVGEVAVYAIGGHYY